MFQVIAGGRIAHHPGTPDYPTIARILGDAPTCVPLVDTKEMPSGLIVAWVGDNYIASERGGTNERDVIASVMMWNLGAPRQPYAGNIILTGLAENGWDGKYPVSLTSEGAFAISVVMTDAQALVGGIGDPHPDLPDAVRSQFVADGNLCREMDYESEEIWKDVRF